MGAIFQSLGGVLNNQTLAVLQALANGALAFPRNLLDGGDFTTNPFQRNIPGLASAGVISSAISNTVTYFADRWFAVGGASSSILMALVADTGIPGFNQSLKFSRSSANANTAAINFGQVIETADTIKLQGQVVTFSFWAKQGANFSGTGMQVQLIVGTGTNQTAASMVAGTWTTQSSIVNTVQALSTGYVRYQFTATIPATATQVGVLLSYTPVGTAGADDSISFQGLQLEANSIATAFEHRDIEVEISLCQRYCFLIAEPAVGVVVAEGGTNVGANSQVFLIDMPTLMRGAPTVTLAAGSFKVCAGAAAAAATGLAAGTTHIPSAISLTTTLTQAAGSSSQLQGGGGSGWILASADF